MLRGALVGTLLVLGAIAVPVVLELDQPERVQRYEPCRRVGAAITVRLEGTTYAATPGTVAAGCVRVTLDTPAGMSLVIEDVPGLALVSGESSTVCLGRGHHEMYSPIPGHRAQGLETAVDATGSSGSNCGG